MTETPTSWRPNRKIVAAALVGALSWLLTTIGVAESDELTQLITVVAMLAAGYLVPEPE